MNHTIYNLDIAEFFLLQANEKEYPEMWTNYQLSRINFIKGELRQAVYFANEELRLYPDNCRTHYIRGLSYSYMEDLDSAITDFEIFNKCFPNSWAGHNDLAWLWFKKGDTKRVIQIIEEVKDSGMGSVWVQNTYGVALMNEGRYSEAEKALLSAKQNSENMTEEDWGKSYPGNNPLIYKKGLAKLRESINSNIRILQQKKDGL
jgi:tetratricopeptide (TPR) repeat protein